MRTIKVQITNRKSSEELIKEYLSKGGSVTKVKDHKPASRSKPKRAKNKHFVYDTECQTGKRSGSAIWSRSKKEENKWHIK